MIAYNNEWLLNLRIRATITEALALQCINQDTHDEVMAKKTAGFYSPNIFIAIGLAILTLIAGLFSFGLLGLFLGEFRYIGLTFTIIAVAAYYFLEMVVIRRMQHYNSGVDNMLVILVAVALFSGVYAGGYAFFDRHNTYACLLAFAICSFLAARFADTLMGVLAAVALAGFFFFLATGLGAVGKLVAPFVMMVVSGTLYTVAKKMSTSQALALDSAAFSGVQAVFLTCLYAAGNYYIVHELNDAMASGQPGVRDMPLAWFFWIWTFSVPAVYIVLGARNKHTLLLRLGLVFLGAAVLTFRYYYSVLSTDVALMLAGTLLTLTGAFFINYLKTPKGGFTFQEQQVTQRPELSELITGHVIEKAANVSPGNDTNSW